MSRSNNLLETVAILLQVPPGDIGPETSLKVLTSSLAGARLGLALKRIGLQLPGNAVPATFGALEAALNGTPIPAPKAPVSADSAAFIASGLQVGLDIQEIGGLPLADDYWEHDFYREMFDNSEIAYAVVNPEPRKHLAGFWCAKEALRKCDSSFAGTTFSSTVVAHDDGGRPYLLSVRPTGRIRLPHALSISHSGQMATAVVILSSPVVVTNPR